MALDIAETEKKTDKIKQLIQQDLKDQINLFLFHRRYQKMLEGTVPWEERLFTVIAKIAVHIILTWRQIFKRSLDFTASSCGLMVSAPLMILIAFLIKLDSYGPVFFRQKRVGKNGKLFPMIKFRTMRSDAEMGTGPIWAQENDPRITRLGSFLRKTHLDELPQLFNVLRGDMSLVGPRPERPYFVNEFRKLIPNYEQRLCVKPGITGLAQIRQHYDETIEDVKRKVKYDVLYIQKMCPLLDLKILSMTFRAVVLQTGR